MTDAPTAERGGWLVPAASAVALIAGSLLAVTVSLIANPSGSVGPGQGGTTGGLDTRFLAVFFGAPIASLLAAGVTYAAFRFRRPVPGALLGAAVGIAAAGVLGTYTGQIGAWWQVALPPDTNQVAALMAVVIGLQVCVSLGLSVDALRGSSGGLHRTRIAGLVGLLVTAGFFVGALAGGVAAAVTLGVPPCAHGASCGGFSVVDVVEGGTLLGGLIGSVVGAGAAAITWVVGWALSRVAHG
ncbi:MAG TPA: hypothetical protein VFG07_05785 [Thermoplasmata archaeon]|nr:hypothetical protein [Thermoplasmata archaeon]